MVAEKVEFIAKAAAAKSEEELVIIVLPKSGEMVHGIIHLGLVVVVAGGRAMLM